MKYDWQKDKLSLTNEDGELLAEIGFKMMNNDQTFVVERTWVSDQARGQGIAGKITTYFLEEIKTQNKTVLPLCSFTQAYLKKHPEYENLLFKHD